MDSKINFFIQEIRNGRNPTNSSEWLSVSEDDRKNLLTRLKELIQEKKLESPVGLSSATLKPSDSSVLNENSSFAVVDTAAGLESSNNTVPSLAPSPFLSTSGNRVLSMARKSSSVRTKGSHVPPEKSTALEFIQSVKEGILDKLEHLDSSPSKLLDIGTLEYPLKEDHYRVFRFFYPTTLLMLHALGDSANPDPLSAFIVTRDLILYSRRAMFALKLALGGRNPRSSDFRAILPQTCADYFRWSALKSDTKSSVGRQRTNTKTSSAKGTEYSLSSRDIDGSVESLSEVLNDLEEVDDDSDFASSSDSDYESSSDDLSEEEKDDASEVVAGGDDLDDVKVQEGSLEAVDSHFVTLEMSPTLQRRLRFQDQRSSSFSSTEYSFFNSARNAFLCSRRLAQAFAAALPVSKIQRSELELIGFLAYERCADIVEAALSVAFPSESLESLHVIPPWDDPIEPAHYVTAIKSLYPIPTELVSSFHIASSKIAMKQQLAARESLNDADLEADKILNIQREKRLLEGDHDLDRSLVKTSSNESDSPKPKFKRITKAPKPS